MEELLKIAKLMKIEKPDQELIDEGMGEEVLHAAIRIELEERFLIEFDEMEDGWSERLAIIYAGEPGEFVIDEIAVTADWDDDMDGVLAQFAGFKGDAFALFGKGLEAMGLARKFKRVAVVEKPVKYEVWLGPELE
jgi:hypothetical protein